MSLTTGTRGFTLVEILVVLGLLTTLIALGANSYAHHMKRVRDTKQRADIRAIHNALEQYYAICNAVYPTPDSGNVPNTITCGNKTLLETPRAPGDVSYTMTGTGTGYTVCTHALELEKITFCLSNKQ